MTKLEHKYHHGRWSATQAVKHGVDALDVLTALFAGEPWMPPPPIRT